MALPELEQTSPRGWSIDAAGAAVLAFAYAAVGAVVLLGLDFYARHIRQRITEAFDIDGQNNATTWFQGSVLALAALAALLVALTARRGLYRVLWCALAGGILFLAADKTFSVHEKVGAEVAEALNLPDSAARVAWQVVWAPVIITVAITLILVMLRSPHTPQLLVLAMLVGGATKLALEAMMFPLLHFGIIQEQGLTYGFEVEIEETVQLLAFGCLLAAFVYLAVARTFAERPDRA